MAEFRGSARVSGFNAIDLPDNAYRIKQAGQKRIDDLRNVYDQRIQNQKQNLADFQYDQSQVQSALKENQNLEETYRQTYEQAYVNAIKINLINQKRSRTKEKWIRAPFSVFKGSWKDRC